MSSPASSPLLSSPLPSFLFFYLLKIYFSRIALKWKKNPFFKGVLAINQRLLIMNHLNLKNLQDTSKSQIPIFTPSSRLLDRHCFVFTAVYLCMHALVIFALSFAAATVRLKTPALLPISNCLNFPSPWNRANLEQLQHLRLKMLKSCLDCLFNLLHPHGESSFFFFGYFNYLALFKPGLSLWDPMSSFSR